VGAEELHEGGLLGFRSGAFKDKAQSQAMLATQYYNGQGVTTNYDQAFAWAQKSAQVGNILAE
jgi:TPR repeat protein